MDYSEDSPEPSIIVHDDLSSRNILVQDNGELAAVLDWECVAALPLWAACNYPAFLEGPIRRIEPDRTTYGLEEDGETCDPFLEHLENYELPLLFEQHSMEKVMSVVFTGNTYLLWS